MAAQALGKYGNNEDLKRALAILIELGDCSKNQVFVAMAALDALDGLDSRVASVAAALKALPTKGKVPDARYAPYVPRQLKDLQNKLN